MVRKPCCFRKQSKQLDLFTEEPTLGCALMFEDKCTVSVCPFEKEERKEDAR